MNTEQMREALKEAHMLIQPVPAPEVTALELAKAVSERATKIAMLLEAALTHPQEPVNHGPIQETDLYDFAGWLTTRPGVMKVGSTSEAGPMAEAVAEYIKTYPDRFAPKQAPEPARVGGVPDIRSHVVNESCWKFTEAMPHTIPPYIWNALKPAIYAALVYYHEQMLAAAPQAPADVVRDAERYRWLRDSENQRHEDDVCVSDSYFNAYFGEELDAAIDAAMSTKAGKGGAE